MQQIPTMQEPPTFPRTNIQITPQGLIVSILFAPNISTTTIIDKDTMQQVVKQWREMMRGEQNQLQLIQHVMESKNS